MPTFEIPATDGDRPVVVIDLDNTEHAAHMSNAWGVHTIATVRVTRGNAHSHAHIEAVDRGPGKAPTLRMVYIRPGGANVARSLTPHPTFPDFSDRSDDRDRDRSPTVYVVPVNAGNDRNGNPRRGWWVHSADGAVLDFYADEYNGEAIVRRAFPNHVMLPRRGEVSVADYRAGVKVRDAAPVSGVARAGRARARAAGYFEADPGTV